MASEVTAEVCAEHMVPVDAAGVCPHVGCTSHSRTLTGCEHSGTFLFCATCRQERMVADGLRSMPWEPGAPHFLRDRRLPRPVEFVTDAFERLLQEAEGEDWQREGLAETPARAAEAWAERTRGYLIDPASVFKTFDGEGYDEMVALAPIPFHSTCEHHLEDFDGVAAVVYVADGKIVGLSKMARLVDVFALRLQNQERLTQQIADAMVEHLQPKGVMVRMEGSHKCCERRGVRKTGMVARTSVVRGLMKDDARARSEALDLIR